MGSLPKGEEGSAFSQEGSRQNLRPRGPGEGIGCFTFPGFLERISFEWACWSHFSDQSLRQRGTGFHVACQAPFQLEGFPPVLTHCALLRTVSPLDNRSVPLPTGISRQLGLCCSVLLASSGVFEGFLVY